MLRRLLTAVFPIGRFTPHGRSVVFLIWMVGVLQAYAGAHAASTIPFARATLGLSEGDMSLVLAVARLAGFLALAFSFWSDRAGRRRPFLAAFTLLVAASTATALVQSGWQFAVMQAVVRASGAAVGILAVILLAEHISPHLRAFSVSLYGAGGSFGAGLGLIVLPIADLDPEAWRWLFASAAVGFAALPLLFRRITESPVFEVEEPVGAPLRTLVRSRFRGRFAVSGAVNFLVNVFTAVALAFTIERFVDDLGFSTGTAVLISLVGGTIGGSGFFIGGRIADVVGRRFTSVAALVLTLAGGVGVYRLEDPVWLGVAVFFSTFGSFAFVPAAGSHRAELFPTAFRTTANTAGAYLGMVGSATGLLLGRLTIDRFGLSDTITGLAAAAAVAILLTLLLPETRGQDLERVSADT